MRHLVRYPLGWNPIGWRRKNTWTTPMFLGSVVAFLYG